MDAGDFDNTPAPSAQPSLAALRQDKDPSRSAPSPLERVSSYRHNLLRTSANETPLLNRDAPVAPVLSRDSPPEDLKELPDLAKADRENQNVDPNPRSSVSSPVSPINLPSNRGISPPIPASERICLDPLLHPKETHSHAHHPGLLASADFCDAGAPVKESEHVVLSPGLGSSDSDRFSMRSGEIYRSLPDGKVLSERVVAPVFKTPGHSRSVKVRPAQPLLSDWDDVLKQGAQRDLPTGFSQNKVKPFSPRPQNQSLGDSPSSEESNLDIQTSKSPSELDHGSNGSNRRLLGAKENLSPDSNLNQQASNERVLSPNSTSSERDEVPSGARTSRAELVRNDDTDANSWEPGDEIVGQEIRKTSAIPRSTVHPLAEGSASDFTTRRYHLHANKARPYAELVNDAESPSATNVGEGQRSVELPTAHYLDECEKLNQLYGQGAHRMSYCVRTPDEALIFGHRLPDCEFNPLPWYSSRHSFKDCSTSLVSPLPESHVLSGCEEIQLESPFREHARSDCTRYHVAPSPLGHHINKDNRASYRQQGNFHSTSQCESYPKPEQQRGHGLDCDPPLIDDVRPNAHPMHDCVDLSTVRGPELHNLTDHERNFAQASWLSSDSRAGGERFCRNGRFASRNHRVESCHEPGGARSISLPALTLPRSHPHHGRREYTSTLNWLRNLLSQPDSQNPNLTQLPRRKLPARSRKVEQRRVSDPMIMGSSLSRQRTGMSIQSISSSPRVDGITLSRTINNLETLLTEAITLAAQVIPSPEKWSEKKRSDSRTSMWKPNSQDTYRTGSSRRRIEQSQLSSQANVEDHYAKIHRTPKVANYSHNYIQTGRSQEAFFVVPQRISSQAARRRSPKCKRLDPASCPKVQKYKNDTVKRLTHLPCDE